MEEIIKFEYKGEQIEIDMNLYNFLKDCRLYMTNRGVSIAHNNCMNKQILTIQCNIQEVMQNEKLQESIKTCINDYKIIPINPKLH